ncbi:hypothetical protein G4B88_028889 [Cannabis sativa]|uniref:Uncharacterized protein n=1 Tax=Cannabis sativa TaxID=3483 RepID=A0A7J6HNI2_CANSA|nr:hypothetical protein G4B88_028889 [Cannabis sativa]
MKICRGWGQYQAQFYCFFIGSCFASGHGSSISSSGFSNFGFFFGLRCKKWKKINDRLFRNFVSQILGQLSGSTYYQVKP